MDNLKDYGEDATASSTSLGQSLERLPSSSEGLPSSTSSQTSLMAASTTSTTRVTSGLVPAVSAPTTPASSAPQDSSAALEDIPPPPPPAEPYEAFLARISGALASLPVDPTRPPCPAVVTSTTSTRLPMPFPRYEDSTWATQPQAPGVRIRMPLPASCYVNPPAPWVWPGRGSVVAVTRVRGPQPPTSTTGLSGLPGPAALPLGSSDVGPTAVPPPATPSMTPFIPMAQPSTVNIAAPPQMPQDVETFPQGPPLEMVKGWKDELLQDMKSYWQKLIGDAPPQSTVGPAVSHENMGPDALRQLSPSDDREASRAGISPVQNELAVTLSTQWIPREVICGSISGKGPTASYVA